MIRRIFHNVTIAIVLFVASGCLLTTSNTLSESGKEVPRSTLRQVELGKTTGDWLIATLGEPSSRAPARAPGNIEIWRYDHQSTKRSSSALFLLFAGTSQKVKDSTTYFEITDGVVTKHWTEQS